MNTLAIDILTQLRVPGKFGLGIADLLRDLRAMRHRELTQPQLEAAVRELADRAWVAQFTSPLSGARWRITALGESTLQEEGL